MSYRDALSGRHSAIGYHYIVTAVTAQRVPLFRDFQLAAIVARELHALDHECRCGMVAWVIMPDHLHALIVLGDMKLAQLMQRLKGRTAYTINRHRESRARVWQQGFHDHALRREESIPAVARYVIANPLRAQIALRLSQYSFWDQRLVDVSRDTP
ncbi:MAG: transposase [Betaproteobacteria bacterium]